MLQAPFLPTQHDNGQHLSGHHALKDLKRLQKRNDLNFYFKDLASNLKLNLPLFTKKHSNAKNPLSLFSAYKQFRILV